MSKTKEQLIDDFLTETRNQIDRTDNEMVKGSADAIACSMGIKRSTLSDLSVGLYFGDKASDLMSELYVLAGKDPDSAPVPGDRVLVVPYPHEDGFMLCFVMSRGIIRPKYLSDVVGDPTTGVYNKYTDTAHTVYLCEDPIDFFIMSECGQGAVMVQVNGADPDVGPLQKLKSEYSQNFALCPNYDIGVKEQRRQLVKYASVGAVLSEIGKDQYMQSDDRSNEYRSLRTFYAAHPDELSEEIIKDAVRVHDAVLDSLLRVKESIDQYESVSSFAKVRSGVYESNIKALAGRRIISTGIKRLDDNIGGGLYPSSLYMIAAAPSTGKTSLCMQMVDEILLQGYNVVFVSLEQTETELITKSLSRQSYVLSNYNKSTSLSTYDLLFRSDPRIFGETDNPQYRPNKAKMYHKVTEQYNCPVDRYGYVDTGRLFVVHDPVDIANLCDLAGVPTHLSTKKSASDADLDVDVDYVGMRDRIGLVEINDLIDAYNVIYNSKPPEEMDDYELRRRAPILFIDYLQILKPLDDGMTDKQSVDANVSGLRRLVAKHGLTAICVTSLNRDGYKAPDPVPYGKEKSRPYKVPTLANLKESGGAEYGADCVLAMYDKGKRKEDVRTVYIRNLKNRNGPTDRTSKLLYVPEFNLFTTLDLNNTCGGQLPAVEIDNKDEDDPTDDY